MSDHSHDRLDVKTDTGRDISTQAIIVRRWRGSVEALHGAEDHHDRAEARGEELEVLLVVAPGGHDPLAQLQQLPHRLVLELQAEMLAIYGDAIERRRAVQDAVTLE